MSKIFRIPFWLALIVFAGSCATPTSPTGGPRDKEGPKIVSTKPESGTTNFSGRSVGLEFSEFVDRNSFNNAVTIEPDIGMDYSLDWGRKSVAVEFEEKLPDLTTIIISIGTDVRDVNGNKMASPRKIAVSTGPEIDEGKIKGRILDAVTGKGNEGHRILLYRSPFDLSKKADYIAGTDTSGSFQFSYLRQGEYKAFWVEDRNRNKIWDRERERAQPFLRETITLEKAASDSLSPLYVAPSDTTDPTLQGTGLFSSRRLRMRFSENIELDSRTRINVTDSLGNSYTEAFPLYISPTDPYVLYAQSGKELRETDSYRVHVMKIKDPFGNMADSTSQAFTGSSQSDTTQQRIIGRRHQTGLYPEEPVELTYAAPIGEQAVVDSITIVKGTGLMKEGRGINVERNTLQVKPREGWEKGVEYEIRFWNPLLSDFKYVNPVIWHKHKMGRLSVQLQDTLQSQNHRLQLISRERGLMVDTTYSSAITVDSLPPIAYRVVSFVDRNGNGKWDHGTVEPYTPPEPYLIRRNVPVKSGFTSDLTVSFE